jgi:hypothetical protein
MSIRWQQWNWNRIDIYVTETAITFLETHKYLHN